MAVVVDRMLPTYTRHAARRATEMSELAQTIANSGMQPCVIEAVRQMHELMAAIPFTDADGTNVTSFVQSAARAGLLNAGAVAAE